MNVSVKKWIARTATAVVSCIVVIIAAQPVDATAASLFVAKAGTGSGSVKSSSSGISCGSSCSTFYWWNTKVTLTATANAGSIFSGWSGVCSGTAPSSTFLLQRKSTCTATFATTQAATTPKVSLAVSKSGSGVGVVTSAPVGISCGSACTYDYSSGTTVTLTAAPAAGSIFSGWSGNCAGTTASTQVTLAANSTCAANFSLSSPTTTNVSLVVSKAGSGAGTINSTPSGIACGSACTFAFAANSTVTLSAVPATGSTFGGWSGNCSGTSSSTQIVLANGSNCVATFALAPTTKVGLWVTPTGTGSGSVSSAPAGISCGSVCTYNFDPNTTITLTASASAGSTFTGWSGSCTGTAANAQVMLTANSTCYAGFSLNSTTPTSANARYLSPNGNNAADGLTPATPWKTFAKAFAAMASGDELILLDGQYSPGTTGVMHWDTAMFGANSAQPKSGISLTRMTIVHAQNPGKVTINGALFIGRSTRKDSYIKIQGITFEGGGDLYNTSFITIKDCGIHGPFGIGTNDHQNGNTDNLIEDVWVWASGQRIIAINYQADRNVWRRVVVRGDGCGTSACSGSGNPNVGFTVYDSRDISVQNVIVVDRILAGTDSPYGNFATAQHTASADRYLGRNDWLGAMSINTPDAGFHFEADATIPTDPTWTMKNIVVTGNGNMDGINVGASGRLILTNATLVTTNQVGDGIRVAPGSPGMSVANLIVKGFNRGINSYLTPSYTDTYGSALLYNQTTPNLGVLTSNPTADGSIASLRYPLRVEAGSLLKGKGSSGTDIGANVANRYGVDGSRFGETNYNTLSTNALWPWPNQARIKQEMCANTQRGFCSTGLRLDASRPISLTSYIWEQLGSAVPTDIDP